MLFVTASAFIACNSDEEVILSEEKVSLENEESFLRLIDSDLNQLNLSLNSGKLQSILSKENVTEKDMEVFSATLGFSSYKSYLIYLEDRVNTIIELDKKSRSEQQQ